MNPDKSPKKKLNEAQREISLYGPYKILVEPYLEEITEMREDGMNVQQISKSLGITPKELYVFIRQHPELYKAWHNGTIAILMNLEEAVYRAALGYEYEEREEQILENSDGEIYGKKYTIKKKYAAPNANLLLKALKAIDPDRWGDSVQSKIPDNNVIDTDLLEYSE